MQKTFIIGNITKDIELRYTKDNKAIAKFSVAVSRQFNKDKTDFFNCTAFGKTAEFVNTYFGKGRKIAIIGRMESDKYEEKLYWNLIVDEVDFADGKKSGDSGGYTEANDSGEELPF